MLGDHRARSVHHPRCLAQEVGAVAGSVSSAASVCRLGEGRTSWRGPPEQLELVVLLSFERSISSI